MSDFDIRERCENLGLGQCGLNSVRAWVQAGLYHLSLPGCLEDDARWSMNHALRAASIRIVCQGRAGKPVFLARVMSRKASDRLDDLAKESDRKTALNKWAKEVTFEHQDRVSSVQAWAVTGGEGRPTVDTIVRRLLMYPAVLIDKAEDQTLNRLGLRTRGEAPDRYAQAGIVPVIRPCGAAEALGFVGRKNRFLTDPFEPFAGEAG